MIGDFFNTIIPLLLYSLVAIFYVVFVFIFHPLVANRKIFNINRYATNMAQEVLLYISEYLILFPLFIFFWFMALGILLSALGAPSTSMLPAAIAITLVVRILCYFREDLAKDLVEILSFTLLAVVIISFSSFQDFNLIQIIKDFGIDWKPVVHYWIFICLIEYLSRGIYELVRYIKQES